MEIYFDALDADGLIIQTHGSVIGVVLSQEIDLNFSLIREAYECKKYKNCDMCMINKKALG